MECDSELDGRKSNGIWRRKECFGGAGRGRMITMMDPLAAAPRRPSSSIDRDKTCVRIPNRTSSTGTGEPHPESRGLCEMAHKNGSDPAHTTPSPGLRRRRPGRLRRGAAARSPSELCRTLNVPDVPPEASASMSSSWVFAS
ncbi:uncharacterized protein LOC123318707 [Coccinella septempunctata]|uniref:uncharacterized protein LOC123318707 n=1 Tax=Coccinella septempunctata TaxID=41139 RepID=UPI001D099E65|nr:uncharacterized protein LOC123318707 [Coccinella septempunctata]